MTAKEIRETDHIRWKDPWAWMERMRGKRWEGLLRDEKRRHQTLLRSPAVASLAPRMKQELADAHQYLYLSGFTVGGGLVDVVMTPEPQFAWKRSWHKRYKKAYDLDVDQEHVWYVTGTDTPYVQELICEDHSGKKKWSKHDVASEVAVVGDKCYYIRSEEKESTSRLYTCDARTGRQERILYEEKRKERSLELVKGAGHTLYLLSEDTSQGQTFLIHDQDHVRPVFQGTQFQMPLGKGAALVRHSIHTPWVAQGSPVSDWKLPPPQEEIVWANAVTGHVVTIHEGSETLWFCAPFAPPTPLLRLKAGSFFYHVWEAWENAPQQHFMVQSPFHIPCMIRVLREKVVRVPSSWPISRPVAFKPLEVHKGHTLSADGTSVSYVTVYQQGTTPKAQVVYVYGAYGLSSLIQWPHAYWYPLLKRGWAMVYAFVRGGGDDTEAWADAARRENRLRSIEDYEAVIHASQRNLRLSPQKTVLYGRSAGGVPVGAVVARWPKGEMAGAAFTEVPYVDVLRTSTNPQLPLTVGEYKEFGNPSKRIVNLNTLLRVSPVNALPAEGAPGVFVLTRVGLEDRQVFAYESFKWVQRLRGSAATSHLEEDAKGKFIAWERKEEHVYRPSVYPHFRGLDLAVLDAWAEGRLRLSASPSSSSPSSSSPPSPCVKKI